MNRPTISRARLLGAAGAAIAFGAYLLLIAVPVQAAASDCTYDAVTNRVSFVMGAADGWLGVSGSAIVANDADDGVGATQCGVATVTNTDGVDVHANGATGILVVDLRGGAFAPGESPENTGAAEIEIDVDGEATLEIFQVRGTDADDTIVVGANEAADGLADTHLAVNWNGDADADVTVAGLDDPDFALTVFGDDGNDTISLNGGSGTGGNLEMIHNTVFGGSDQFGDSGGAADDGDDLLTGSGFVTGGSSADRLEGDEGIDVLNGLGGDDEIRDAGDVQDVDGDGTTEGAEDELDVLNGGTGEDVLEAGDGNDVLDGGLDNDIEGGDQCDDLLDQGNGPNGDDDLIGSAGSDTADYSARNSDLFLTNDPLDPSG